jgi:hypothetical protein
VRPRELLGSACCFEIECLLDLITPDFDAVNKLTGENVVRLESLLAKLHNYKHIDLDKLFLLIGHPSEFPLW